MKKSTSQNKKRLDLTYIIFARVKGIEKFKEFNPHTNIPNEYAWKEICQMDSCFGGQDALDEFAETLSLKDIQKYSQYEFIAIEQTKFMSSEGGVNQPEIILQF